MKYSAIASAAFVLAALACGCAASPAPQAPPPREVGAVEINRDTAIRTARYDAAVRYGDRWIAWTSATQLGRYWVVELRAENGKGMRYAISTTDGSIRERSLFQ